MTEHTNAPANEHDFSELEKTMPRDMPLTNSLLHMTKSQALWAIRNGKEWIAYLKSKGDDAEIL